MLGFFQFFRKLQEDDYRKTTSVQEYLMKGKKNKTIIYIIDMKQVYLVMIVLKRENVKNVL